MIEPNWDYFFYYGEGLVPEAEENEFDIIQGVMQPVKSLYYFRKEGAGVQEYENYPNTFILALMVRFAIVKWFAFRNSYTITNNSNRQLAVSQDSIIIDQEVNNMNIDINYRSASDLGSVKATNVLI